MVYDSRFMQSETRKELIGWRIKAVGMWPMTERYEMNRTSGTADVRNGGPTSGSERMAKGLPGVERRERNDA